jgi:acylphosphatase
MELISVRIPSPSHTNNGKMNCAGASRVSLVKARKDSEERRRRSRWTGKAIVSRSSVADNAFMKRDAAKRWLIDGAVQGVGFRFFVQHKATALGLSGWTRNLDDGRVEVYATGEAEHLADLDAALYIGPRMARVRSVEAHDAAVENLSSFSIR